MSWETILKRGKAKSIFYRQFRAALEQAIDPYETFTLPEIIPLARELYKDEILDGNLMVASAAEKHASAKLNITNRAYITQTIHHIGTHRKSKKKDNKNEFIYRRI
jgi:hypothetical protein